MKIIPLSEGAFTVDRSKQFVPFDLQKDKLQQRPPGSLLVEIQPFVIITSKDILLLDTGLGFTNANGLQIHKNLFDNGINPSDVTKVLLSHLHKDHAGGISKKENDTGSLNFANAVYYINQNEFNFAFEKGAPSFSVDDFAVLTNSPQVQFLNDSGTIDDYIKHEITGGHSPYHQVFWIKEEGETIFFGGDVAPQLQQMKNRFIAKYDYDGKKSMQLRQEWRTRGEQENWQFLFYHDIKYPIYKF